jgi:hypothetical protein
MLWQKRTQPARMASSPGFSQLFVPPPKIFKKYIFYFFNGYDGYSSSITIGYMVTMTAGYTVICNCASPSVTFMYKMWLWWIISFNLIPTKAHALTVFLCLLTLYIHYTSLCNYLTPFRFSSSMLNCVCLSRFHRSSVNFAFIMHQTDHIFSFCVWQYYYLSQGLCFLATFILL